MTGNAENGGRRNRSLRISGAQIACALAVVMFLTPFFIPRALLEFGFSFFLSWAALCVAAVLANRLVIWAILGAGPLAMVSLDWLQGPRIDEFGFYPWSEIALFLGIAIVIAATGILSVLQTTIQANRKVR